MDEKIGVSVVCTVYNHAKYLRECLDGFVSQKTNFLFEVIVHDDASTDSSAEIIREYAEKYPEIIKPIIQVENQYSQGADIIKEFIVPVVRGEYVALCEGDDFWCDSSKLQKQYNALQDHPECFMCTNKVERVCEDGRSQNFYYPAIKVKEGVLSSKNFLETCRGHVFQTSSYFFCAEPWKTFSLNPPEFKQLSDVGDEPYLLFFGQLGAVYYIDQIMSKYRVGVPGSWSSRQDNLVDIEKITSHHKCMIACFKSYDRYTNYAYHDICIEKIAAHMTLPYALEKKCREFFLPENRIYLRKRTFKSKVFILIACVFPTVGQRLFMKKRAGWKRTRMSK